MAVLARTDGRPLLPQPPQRNTLAGVAAYAEAHPVVAAAIDAQLTWAASEEEDSGFRPSDHALRRLLPREARNWVASQNSLMAVPVRGRQLAEVLSPTVGTIVETHPRACLYFADPSLLGAIKRYKSPQGTDHARELWQAWTGRFGIGGPEEDFDVTDGALDALVCATVAYLYHHAPEELLRLPYPATNKRGRGPFYVVRPAG
jgi:predicted nuclease with RNAse H fold